MDVVLGVDVAASKGDWCLLSGVDILEEGASPFSDLPALLESWASRGWVVTALACEYTGGMGAPWLVAARAAGLGSFILHTADRSAYKRMCQQSTKTDKADARTIAKVFSMWLAPELRSVAFLPSHLFQPFELVSKAWELRELVGDVRRALKSRVAASARAGAAERSGAMTRAGLWHEEALHQQELEKQFMVHAMEYAKREYTFEYEILLSVPCVADRTACMVLGALMPLDRFVGSDGLSVGLVRRVRRYVGFVPRYEASGGRVMKNENYRGGYRDFRAVLLMCGRSAANPANRNAAAVYYRSLLARGVAPKKAVYRTAQKILLWCIGVLRTKTVFNDIYAPEKPVKPVLLPLPGHLIGGSDAARLCGMKRTTLIMRSKTKDPNLLLSLEEWEGKKYFLRAEIESLGGGGDA